MGCPSSVKGEEWKAKVAKCADVKNMIHVIDKCLAELTELSKVHII